VIPGPSQSGIHGLRLAGLLILVSALSVVRPAGVTAEESEPFDFTYPKQRLEAPAFQLPDLNGNTVSLEGFRGKIVLVHFWATFCVPCLEEMPVLESLWQEYGGEGLVILGIAGDRGKIDIVREFAGKTGVNFPVLHDRDGRVRKQYEVVALPTTYLVGRDGKISGRAVGTRSWDEPDGRAIIEKLLYTEGLQ
jgi:cytochrome c biogenesis protein CcmG/thiol:disulfide interchange protein DsbE